MTHIELQSAIMYNTNLTGAKVALSTLEKAHLKGTIMPDGIIYE
jgi:uncharacterized protein YjbI with pentapeptide repeats